MSAEKSSAPDNDKLSYHWWIYPEAGSYKGTVAIESDRELNAAIVIPDDAAGKQIHLILEVKDNSEVASLFDYRRVVVNVIAARVE